MCGIVYAYNFNGDSVNNQILQQFDKQRDRGTRGFGLFDGQEMHMVHKIKEEQILNWLCRYDSDHILFHHRLPTSTENIKRAAHPFSTKDYFGDTQYIMVHNGSLRNDDELRDKHIDEFNVQYKSDLEDGDFNDSEALLWEFSLYMEGKIKEFEARGAIALICIKKVKGKLDKLYFLSNSPSTPLNIKRDDNEFLLSSEGEGEKVEEDKLFTFDFKSKQLTDKPMTINRWTNNNNWQSNYAGLSKQTNFIHDPNTQQLIPEYEGYPDYEDDIEYYDKTDYEDHELCSPTNSEVESKMMDYLVAAGGIFEMAYWDVESDYLKIINKSGDTKQKLLLEGVLEAIELDPEYQNEKSISSIVRTLWEDTKTA